MRANKWDAAARLMEKWLASPVNGKTHVEPPSTDIVKMDWVLRFTRAKTKFDEIFSKRLYATDAAKREIVNMVIRTTFGYNQRFCSLTRNVLEIENDYVTHYAVPPAYTLDALTGALGGFNYHIAVSGVVFRNCAYIDSVGVYVFDRYDFIDRGLVEKYLWSQDLGAWNKRTNTISFFWGGDSVDNETFRKYQARTKKGGDFEVFSDVKVRILRMEESFKVSLQESSR